MFVAAIFIVGVLVLQFLAGPALKAAVERFLPEITRSPVSVEKIQLLPIFGRAEIHAFAVGNPEGFSTPNAVRIEGVFVRFSPRSLFQDTIIIDRIEITGAEFTMENRGQINNLTVLSQNIEANTRQRTRPPEEKGTPDPAPGRQILIRQLILDNSSIQIQMGAVPMVMNLQRMEFNNLNANTKPNASERSLNEIIGALFQKQQPL